MNTFKCYFDGACEPINPGGAIGAGIYIVGSRRTYKDKYFIPCKPENTNNVAEYIALIKVLEFMANKSGCRIEIFGDSMLVIMQMTGRWKIKHGAYKEYA